MAQLAEADRLTINAWVGARPGVNYRTQDEADTVSVECFGRRITFPAFAREALTFALGHEKLLVGDLPGGSMTRAS